MSDESTNLKSTKKHIKHTGIIFLNLLSNKKNPQDYHDNFILPDKVKLNLMYLDKKNFTYDLLIIIRNSI